MKMLDVIAAVLLVVGGLNWGLVGLANFDLVAWLSGAGAFGARNEFGATVYAAVGLAALYRCSACARFSGGGVSAARNRILPRRPGVGRPPGRTCQQGLETTWCHFREPVTQSPAA